jgi:hypothetical protein
MSRQEPRIAFRIEQIVWHVRSTFQHEHWCNKKVAAMTALKQWLLEWDIPGIGSMSITELCGASRASNCAIEKPRPNIQGQHSYIAADRTFCIYLVDGDETIRSHSELSGIPVDAITEIPNIIDPLTANN